MNCRSVKSRMAVFLFVKISEMLRVPGDKTALIYKRILNRKGKIVQDKTKIDVRKFQEEIAMDIMKYEVKHSLTENMLEQFRKDLVKEEKSKATVEKYVRDVKFFFQFMQKDNTVTKEKVIEYKQILIKRYAVSSVNSMIASLNHFFKCMGWYDCVVKSLKIQKSAFRPGEKELTKEEYYRLLDVAKRKEKKRLYCLMQTLCATGIRVSELPFITVKAIQEGRALVSMKNKTRIVILPRSLCRLLKKYMQQKNIKSGSIFVTRTGKPLDRSNIFHEMKKLCEEAGVSQKKVFPHNLRHLFACTYYRMKKDIVHLADLLGHSNINTTRIYTLVSGKEEARQLAKLGLVV